MSYSAFHLELTVKCANCQNIIAVNAAVPVVRCSECNGQQKIGSKVYNLLFEEVFRLRKEISLNEERKTVTEQKEGENFRFVYNKQKLRCVYCKETLSIKDLHKNSIRCSNCHKEVSLRKFPHIEKKDFFLFGEDENQVKEAKGTTNINESVEFECTNCGGALNSNGSKRLVECPYCSSKIMMSDTLWYRLHPTAQLLPWYLLFNDAATDTQKDFEFNGVHDMCYKNGMLYCFGETNNNDYAIWAMTKEHELIWMKILPDDNIDKRMYSKIEIFGSDNLLLWSDDLPSVLVCDLKNGQIIEELGGIEPHNARKHYLDLSICTSLATDPDGSIVAFINERIVRFNKDGEGINMWPERKNFLGMKRKEKLKPLYENLPESIRPVNRRKRISGKFVYPHKLKDRSLIYSSYGGKCTVQIDSEGSVYILSPMMVSALRRIIGGAYLTKFNREGKIQFKVELPTYSVYISQAQIDSEKNIYILFNDSKAELESCLFKVSADGEELKLLIKTNTNILYQRNTSFVIDEAGYIYTINQQGEIRKYDPEGRIIFRNLKAIQKDKEVLED